jgi:hypothetical protein
MAVKLSPEPGRPSGQPRAPEPRSPERKREGAEHEGATEDSVGNLGGPGPGYDEEPEKDPDSGGVSRG